jgi:hypothetical protein
MTHTASETAAGAAEQRAALDASGGRRGSVNRRGGPSMLRIDAARAQLRRPRPWSWCGARPKTGPDDTFEARTAARSARVPVGEVARAARRSLWVSRGPTDHVKYATSPFMTPEPVSAAVSGAALRRPARGGRGPYPRT